MYGPTAATRDGPVCCPACPSEGTYTGKGQKRHKMRLLNHSKHDEFAPNNKAVFGDTKNLQQHYKAVMSIK